MSKILSKVSEWLRQNITTITVLLWLGFGGFAVLYAIVIHPLVFVALLTVTYIGFRLENSPARG